MDRRRHRARGSEIVNRVYLQCAVHFGFSKTVVDEQPISYINQLLLDFYKEHHKMQIEQEKSMRSINKRLR